MSERKPNTEIPFEFFENIEHRNKPAHTERGVGANKGKALDAWFAEYDGNYYSFVRVYGDGFDNYFVGNVSSAELELLPEQHERTEELITAAKNGPFNNIRMAIDALTAVMGTGPYRLKAKPEEAVVGEEEQLQLESGNTTENVPTTSRRPEIGPVRKQQIISALSIDLQLPETEVEHLNLWQMGAAKIAQADEILLLSPDYIPSTNYSIALRYEPPTGTWFMARIEHASRQAYESHYGDDYRWLRESINWSYEADRTEIAEELARMDSQENAA